MSSLRVPDFFDLSLRAAWRGNLTFIISCHREAPCAVAISPVDPLVILSEAKDLSAVN